MSSAQPSDRIPVAEISVRSLHGLHDHPFPESKLAPIQGPEEHPVIDRTDDSGHLLQLPRLFLFVLDVGAERAAAEQPHGSVRECLCGSVHELDSLLHPGSRVDSAPEHDRPEFCEVEDFTDGTDFHRLAELAQAIRDRLCDPFS